MNHDETRWQERVLQANESIARNLRLQHAKEIKSGPQNSEKYRREGDPDDNRPQHPVAKMFEGLEQLENDVAEGSYYAAASVRDLAVRAIQILETSWVWKDLAWNSFEWPQLVPGGPEDGPLFRSWCKDWKEIKAGGGLPMPKSSDVKFNEGKPANLALYCYRTMLPIWMGHRADAQPEDPIWTELRGLPALSPVCAKEWRDVAIKLMEQTEPDFRIWLQEIPGNINAAKQEMKRKRTDKSTSKGTVWENIENYQPDSATSRSAVKKALLHGFESLSNTIDGDWAFLHELSGEDQRSRVNSRKNQ